jgi:hypothetical protein
MALALQNLLTAYQLCRASSEIDTDNIITILLIITITNQALPLFRLLRTVPSKRSDVPANIKSVVFRVAIQCRLVVSFFTFKNVQRFTCTEQKVPRNSNVHKSLQNCWSLVWKFSDVTNLAAGISNGLLYVRNPELVSKVLEESATSSCHKEESVTVMLQRPGYCRLHTRFPNRRPQTPGGPWVLFQAVCKYTSFQ